MSDAVGHSGTARARSGAGRTGRALRSAGAFVVLSYFVLPDTPFSATSPLRAVEGVLRWHPRTAFAWGELAACVAVMYCYHVARPRQPPDGQTLIWYGTALYLGSLSISGVMARGDGLQMLGCMSVLLPTLMGLLAALLAGSAAASIRVIALTVAVSAAYAVAFVVAGTHVYHSGTLGRAGGTYLQPTELYRVTVLGLPLMMALVADASSLSSAFAWSSGLGLTFTALVATFGRGGMLATAVGLSWMTFRLPHPRAVRWVIVAALIVATVAVVYARQAGSEADRTSAVRSAIGRIALAKRGWNVFLRHPISGVGAAAVALPVDVPGSRSAHQILLQPKNLYLFWMDQFGISGLLLIGWFIVAVSRAFRNSTGPLALGVQATWLTVAVAGLADTPFGTAQTSVGNALVGALLGTTMRLAATTAADPEADRRVATAEVGRGA